VLRIVSWNLNGLRAAHRKGFLAWLDATGAEIVALQEIRARPEQLPAELRAPPGWHARFVPAERPGYSGVALYARRAPDAVTSSLGVPALDVEGRVLMARFGRLTVVSAYFPKSAGRHRDNSRLPYKLRFDRRLLHVLSTTHARGRVLVLGDFNTAPEEIDLARPRQNLENSGFLPAERRAFARWRRAGWVDAFRRFEPGPGHYTWWSQRRGVRARNVGWRLDLVLASPAAMRFVRGAALHPEVTGSDHCPVSVDVDAAIFGPSAEGSAARSSASRLGADQKRARR
jgi:exodeoxyribonuclease-3